LVQHAERCPPIIDIAADYRVFMSGGNGPLESARHAKHQHAARRKVNADLITP
jgi:hypothetical protein